MIPIVIILFSFSTVYDEYNLFYFIRCRWLQWEVCEQKYWPADYRIYVPSDVEKFDPNDREKYIVEALSNKNPNKKYSLEIKMTAKKRIGLEEFAELSRNWTGHPVSLQSIADQIEDPNFKSVVLSLKDPNGV